MGSCTFFLFLIVLFWIVIYFFNCFNNLFFNYIYVGSRFSDRAHYNEFVESEAKSWAAMRQRLVLGMKDTQNLAAQSSQGEGTPRSRTGMRQPPLDHARASLLFLGLCLLWMVSVVIYSSLPFILLLHLSVIHAYPQVHVPSAILAGALWAVVALITMSRGHIHIKGGQGVSCVYLIRRWQLFLGWPPHLFPYS